MTKDDVYKVMEERKEDIYVVGDGNQSFAVCSQSRFQRYSYVGSSLLLRLVLLEP